MRLSPPHAKFLGEQEVALTALSHFREVMGLPFPQREQRELHSVGEADAGLRGRFQHVLLQQRALHEKAQRNLHLAHREALQQQVCC